MEKKPETKKNLNDILKEIKIFQKLGKNNVKHYYIGVKLINGNETEIYCEKEFVDLVKLYNEQTGGKGIKARELAEETSEKSGGTYFYVKFTLYNDNIYKFFFKSFAFKDIIKALLAA